MCKVRTAAAGLGLCFSSTELRKRGPGAPRLFRAPDAEVCWRVKPRAAGTVHGGFSSPHPSPEGTGLEFLPVRCCPRRALRKVPFPRVLCVLAGVVWRLFLSPSHRNGGTCRDPQKAAKAPSACMFSRMRAIKS